jgi:hypothetical protein
VDIFVKLVWVGNTRHDESLHGTGQCPKSGSVDLSDNVVGNTVLLRIPSSRNLTSDSSVKLDGFRNIDPSTLLELDKPLARFLEPDITLVALFSLESSGILGGDLQRLEIVVELDFLVE